MSPLYFYCILLNDTGVQPEKSIKREVLSMTADDVRIEDLSRSSRDEIVHCCRAKRGSFPEHVEKNVAAIIADVAEKGDSALRRYAKKFDGTESKDFRVNGLEIADASKGVDDSLAPALDIAIERVRRFHEHNLQKDWKFTDELGDVLGQKCTPLKRVGIYIPGGKAAYPSSLIMTAVPAMAAGVGEIVVTSPPSSFVAPSALCAVLQKLGCINEVYRVGGVQGIAALALGTESIPRVDKIAGPGNIYVALAKKLLFGYVDIDMVAGPSEVLVITDGSIHPRVTASDLIAQAEHDENAKALCAVKSLRAAGEVAEWIAQLAGRSPRKEIIEKSIRQNGCIYIVKDVQDAVFLANEIAPEHLELQVMKPQDYVKDIINAGAIFIGRYSAEAFGDYIAGPSHVLPTGGTARFFSPLNALSFMKFSSIVRMSKRGADVLGKHARILAESEGLYAHAQSVGERLEERDQQGDYDSPVGTQ